MIRELFSGSEKISMGRVLSFFSTFTGIGIAISATIHNIVSGAPIDGSVTGLVLGLVGSGIAGKAAQKWGEKK